MKVAEMTMADLEAFVREIVRKAQTTGLCVAESDDGRPCVRDAGHAERHRFAKAEQQENANQRRWFDVGSVMLETGRKTTPLLKASYGDYVKVSGERKAWMILRIEFCPGETKWNVEVKNAETGRSRTVDSKRLQFLRYGQTVSAA